MNFNDQNELIKNGFQGFKTVAELWENKTCIPKVKGVYFVLYPGYRDYQFVNPGVGGFFNSKDPNIEIAKLREEIVTDSLVIYIGKAGSPSGGATLNSRLGQFLRFGRTKKVDHWNGRYIWQIKNPNELIICWKTTPDEDPRAIQKNYLEEFHKIFRRIPFANTSA